MSVPISEITLSAVLASIPVMVVRSTPVFQTIVRGIEMGVWFRRFVRFAGSEFEVGFWGRDRKASSIC